MMLGPLLGVLKDSLILDPVDDQQFGVVEKWHCMPENQHGEVVWLMNRSWMGFSVEGNDSYERCRAAACCRYLFVLDELLRRRFPRFLFVFAPKVMNLSPLDRGRPVEKRFRTGIADDGENSNLKFACGQCRKQSLVVRQSHLYY